MTFKEQIIGFAVVWVALHLIGLSMYLSGYTGSNYPAYSFISSIWQFEGWILVALVAGAAIYIILNLYSSRLQRSSLPEIQNKTPEQNRPPDIPCTPPLAPNPSPKPQVPSPKDLKDRAISQILGKDQK